MKSCLGCKWAKWQENARGHLHPLGDGVCKKEYAVPPLPASMHWLGKYPPRPLGGHINRREEHKDHCPYYERGMA